MCFQLTIAFWMISCIELCFMAPEYRKNWKIWDFRLGLRQRQMYLIFGFFDLWCLCQMKEEIKTEILSTQTCQKPIKNALEYLFELLGTNKKCPTFMVFNPRTPSGKAFLGGSGWILAFKAYIHYGPWLLCPDEPLKHLFVASGSLQKA